VAVSQLPESFEHDPNNSIEQAQPLAIPASINGRLYIPENPEMGDVDLYRFEADKGQQVVIETRAATMGSPSDTKIEVLDDGGNPVPYLLFQATKDSWITLRSEDSSDSAIRLGQFDEMELNDYMYFNGEILKIFRLARGPDSDMFYFTRDGVRRAWFFSSPAGHGLDEPCYVVVPKAPGSKIVPNGLPVFTHYYSNDDDGERQLGKDSRLIFTAPTKSRYLVRVTDTRGWSGERFAYRLILRAPEPDFAAMLVAKGTEKLGAGSGLQFVVKVDRRDGFVGDVRVDVNGVPEGFFVSTPIVVQSDHLTATGAVFARPDLKPGKVDFSQVKLIASARSGDREISHPAGSFPDVTVVAAPQLAFFLEPDSAGKPTGDGKTAPAKPFEVTLAPGERVPVWLRLDRRGNDALLALDVENLPNGVIVDSVGLNGVQIREKETVREVFLSCAKWVPEQERLCHAIAGNAAGSSESVPGQQTSFPVLLKIRKNSALASLPGAKN
jgi:hypothetical protein